ncbi:nickel transporter permease [Paenibacillus sp. 598K]|uniref:nickel transporter permease n=1 Tax=Paenibacillus sp. 598K TaxID=1117987 RepID=UPI00269F4053
MIRNTMNNTSGVWLGGSILLLYLLAGLLAPWLAPSDPLQIELANKLAPPSWSYPLGTDAMGRCLLSRLIYGIRLSVFYTLLALLLIFAVSTAVGLLSGYIGGKVDQLLMRGADMMLAFPSLILSLAISALLGPGLSHLLLSVALVWWAPYARVIRSIVQQIRTSDYILAAHAVGTSHLGILIRHVLPNAARPILTLASIEAGTILLAISGLSFLGLGAQPPTPEWGAMLSDSRPYLQTQPQLLIYPAIAIMLAVLGFNLLGEGMRAARGGSGRERTRS